jgi:hypothetical protein
MRMAQARRPAALSADFLQSAKLLRFLPRRRVRRSNPLHQRFDQRKQGTVERTKETRKSSVSQTGNDTVGEKRLRHLPPCSLFAFDCR